MTIVLCITLAIVLVLIVWALKGWDTLYYVGDILLETRHYPSDRSPFKRALRKIYRNKQLSELDYDIYCLKEVNRITKTVKYTLATMDDQPELTKKLKESLSEKRNEERS